MHRDTRSVSLVALAVVCCCLAGCPASNRPKGDDRAAKAQAVLTGHASPRRKLPVLKLLPPQAGKANLVDVTDQTGITFVHTGGGGGNLYIVQTVVAGLALFDYDNDGYVDIYFLNGAPNPGVEFDRPPRDELWRNNGDWTFTDVTDEVGVAELGYGLGVVTGDYDGDGDQDLYVNNFGPNVFYRNNGDGTFTDATASAGVGCGLCGAGAAFLDIESDGDLDLYVANYVDFSYERNITESIGDQVYSAGPASYRPQPDMLFRNNGDGTFADVSEESGINSTVGSGMGMICADYDNDRDTDIFICSDNMANQLLQNDGRGKFADVAFAAGVAYDLEGRAKGNMGVTCGDYDNDGRLDFYVTTFSGELSVLYRNMGGGYFTDLTRPSLSGSSTISHAKWGTTLSDFDHDGDRDLFVACGHFWIDARYVDDRTDVAVPNALLDNKGDGTFEDISLASGDGLGIIACSKGAGFDDLDNDGDVDVVVLNANGKPSILRNDLETSRQSVQIALSSPNANRDGVGARIKIVAGGRGQIAEVYRGQGYQSSYGDRVHFGLGDAERIDHIEVHWLGGRVDSIEEPPSGRLLWIEEGGRCRSLPGK